MHFIGIANILRQATCTYRIHRKFAPFFAQIFAKKFVKCKNLHKKLRKHLRHDYFLAFICANICTNFWVSKIFAQRFVGPNFFAKNNHAANVFAFFCANFCTLQFFLQKFAQKKAQIFYGSYMINMAKYTSS